MVSNIFNLSIIRYSRTVADDFRQLVAGSPSTTYLLSNRCKGLIVGTAGTLNVTMKNGHVISNFPVYQGFIPGRFKSIQTGGTAQNIWEVT